MNAKKISPERRALLGDMSAEAYIDATNRQLAEEQRRLSPEEILERKRAYAKRYSAQQRKRR